MWKKAFHAFQEHFDGHPSWNRTKLIVFLLSLDESYDDASVEKMLYYGRLLKESGANRLKFRIDGSYPMDTMDRLANVVDISILGVRSYVPERAYNSCARRAWKTGSIPAWGRRTAIRWVAGRLAGVSRGNIRRVPGQFGNSTSNSLRAWMYPETYVERNGDVQNGEGFLIYRGERTMGLDEPVASIRPEVIAARQPGLRIFLAARAQERRPHHGGPRSANSVIHAPLGTNGA